MNKQLPLKLRTCVSCERKFYSRSSLSKYCCVAHQVASWRERNKFSQEQLEVQFMEQENNKVDQEVA